MADIIFLVDNSGSLTMNGWIKELELMRDIIEELEVSTKYINAAVILFDDGSVDWLLDANNNQIWQTGGVFVAYYFMDDKDLLLTLINDSLTMARKGLSSGCHSSSGMGVNFCPQITDWYLVPKKRVVTDSFGNPKDYCPLWYNAGGTRHDLAFAEAINLLNERKSEFQKVLAGLDQTHPNYEVAHYRQTYQSLVIMITDATITPGFGKAESDQLKNQMNAQIVILLVVDFYTYLFDFAGFEYATGGAAINCNTRSI